MNDFEKFSSQLMSLSASSIFFTDQDGRLTMVSNAAKDHFGSGLCRLEGRPVSEGISDSRLLNAFENAQAALSQGQISFHELTPWDEDNGQSTLRFQGNKVVDEDGSLLGYAYKFSIEATSRRLEFEETMFSNLMRNSQDLIYFKDLNSRFTRVSDSMVERLGADSVDDIVGKCDFDFWDHKCAEGFYKDEQEIIRSRKPLIGKAEQEVRSDGKLTWVLSSKMPLIDEFNNVTGIYGISKDITNQKETEQELENTHKKLLDASRHAGMAEIATNVIHNVGNVLNSINVSISQTMDISRGLKIKNLAKVAELIEQHADEPNFLSENEKGKRIPEYLAMISEELSKDQRDIESELESTKRHLQHVKTIVSMQQEYATANCVIERVDVADVLEDAIGMSSGSLERHRITLVRDFEPGVVVMLDKHRVMQILVNLIRNAKHAVQEIDLIERIIKIGVSQFDDQSVSIAITDNGVGISAENMVNLFNHGFTTKKTGHGFGLHSGANSAKELGGSLTAHSDGPGKGATFKLTLPLESCHSEPSATAPILHSEAEAKMPNVATPVM